MRWTYFSASGICAAALFLTACSQSSKPFPVANAGITGPANSQTVGGPAIPQNDFLNISHAKGQIAQPAVLILNSPAGTAPASAPISGTDGKNSMNMNSMPGMNMKGGTR